LVLKIVDQDFHGFRVIKDIEFSFKKIKLQHIPKTHYKKNINYYRILLTFFNNFSKHTIQEIISRNETA